MLAIFFPIMGFVLAGFEHCVADMYVPAGIFAYLNPAYTGLIDAAGINTALLTFGDFIFANLIPVTLGNIVGGVAVGLVMYACHGTKRSGRRKAVRFCGFPAGALAKRGRRPMMGANGLTYQRTTTTPEATKKLAATLAPICMRATPSF